MGAENGKQVLGIWLADANTTTIRNQKCWFSISLLLVPLMSLYVVPKIIHTKAQYTQQIKKLFNARESWMMQKWINWSESCLLASLTESKMDYLIRTLPVCITHWVKKDYPIRTLSVFITHWVKSMQVRLFSKAARNYLNQKTTCQWTTVRFKTQITSDELNRNSKYISPQYFLKNN